MDETQAALKMFGLVAALTVIPPVRVELLPMASSSPFAGACGWDEQAKCWRILAAKQLEGRRLLYLLFHELYHVKEGQAPKPWAGLEWDRQLMTGQRVTVGAELRQRIAYSKTPTTEQARAESDADKWAEAKTAKWWTLVKLLAEASQ